MTRPTLSVCGPTTEVVASIGSIVLNVLIALKPRSGRRVVLPAGTEAAARRTTATPLQPALARGHRWLRMLEIGKAASTCDIARRKDTNHSYIARHINLTLLSPEIVAATLYETLPECVQHLSLAINPPMLWEEQPGANRMSVSYVSARSWSVMMRDDADSADFVEACLLKESNLHGKR